MAQPGTDLAADIYRHVTVWLRDHSDHKDRERMILAFAGLELNWETWKIERNVDQLKSALEKDDAFRRDLVTELDLPVPMKDVPALVRGVAGAAAAGWATAELKAAFGRTLNWDTWVGKKNLASIESLLTAKPDIRKKVARALRYFPGKDEAGDVARALIARLKVGSPVWQIPGVFTAHTLNWNEFIEGKSEKRFQECLHDNFDFRQAVAAATGYVSEEAASVAELFVEMLKNMRPVARSEAIYKIDEEMKKNLDGPGGAAWRSWRRISAFLAEYEIDPKSDPKVSQPWEKLAENVAGEFSMQPGIAARIWDAMEWPRPFPLVLREEQRQIAWRRTAAEAADLAENAIARLDALPPGRLDVKLDELADLVTRIASFLAERDTTRYQDLIDKLMEYKNAST